MRKVSFVFLRRFKAATRRSLIMLQTRIKERKNYLFVENINTPRVNYLFHLLLSRIKQ